MNVGKPVTRHPVLTRHSQWLQQDIFQDVAEISPEPCPPKSNRETKSAFALITPFTFHLNPAESKNKRRKRSSKETVSPARHCHPFLIQWFITLNTLVQLPLLMLQYLISPSPSHEHIRSSLFGWKSKDITPAECPVKLRSV